MNLSINREFHFGSLLRFALPTIIMMIFMSMYSIVDGIFVSRFVGTDALSATNIIYPVNNVVMAFAIMLSTGGSAVVAKKMGQGNTKSARENLTLIVCTGVICGIVIGAGALFFLEDLCRILGASESLMPYCKDYLAILMIFSPAFVLQILFQTFLVTAGKPMLGLGLTVAAGTVNAVLDYVFIVPMGMGITGAALATACGYLVPAVAGLIYFLFGKGDLHFVVPKLEWNVLAESCFNGSSEMVTNISAGIITFLFNIFMIRFLGEDGVAAITIVLYAQFLLTSLYMGFSMGVAPVISFNHGSNNHNQLKRIFKICIVFLLFSSVLLFAVSYFFSGSIVGIFSPKGSPVYEIAIHGFLLFSISFLFAGFNIFASAMFTALSDGKISAIISFLRTFAFILGGIMILPIQFKIDGLWLAVPFAEILTLVVSIYYIKRLGKKYHFA